MRHLLTSKRRELKLRVKDWFRAFLNLGLLLHVTEGKRPLECRAGSDFFFVDPSGDLLACKGMEEKNPLGSLHESNYQEIWSSKQAESIRSQVAKCDRGCWMVGSAVPAMRKNIFKPIKWVLKNKLRIYQRFMFSEDTN